MARLTLTKADRKFLYEAVAERHETIVNGHRTANSLDEMLEFARTYEQVNTLFEKLKAAVEADEAPKTDASADDDDNESSADNNAGQSDDSNYGLAA